MPFEIIKVYNPSAFTKVGSPAPDVTADGIANNFSNTAYIKSVAAIDFTKIFTIVFNEKRSSSTNFRGFGVGRQGGIAYPILFVQNTNRNNYITLGLYINGTQKTFDYSFDHLQYFDINYIVNWSGDKYNFKIVDNATGNIVLNETVNSYESLSRAGDSKGYVVYGYNFNEGAPIVSTDLKLTKVLNNGLTLYEGFIYGEKYVEPDYNAELAEIKKYYADLLILQYRNKPKARQTIEIGADIYSGDGVLFQLAEVLNIDIAKGAQLDLIGKILGCPRNITGLVINTKYFSFHIDNTSIGFSTVGNPSYGSVKTRANSKLATYGLQDEEYRTLLKFKAFVNRWSGTMAEMDEALYACFGKDINLQDNQDLTVTYEIYNNTIPIQAARLLGYFKAPLGVGVTFTIV